MRRGICLVHHTDITVTSTLIVQVTNPLAILTGNHHSLLGSGLRTSNKQGKVVARPQRSPRSRLRVQSRINDNHCVNSVTSQKNSLHVTGQTGLNPTPVVAKNSKVSLNLNVDYCVANAHIVTGLPQRKGVNPNVCQCIHKNKICERCFLCRSLEFCRSCHQCPSCCHSSTCKGKVTNVLGEMGGLGYESKSSHHVERGLHPPLPVQTQLDPVTNCSKQLPKPSETVQPFRGTVSADKQKCSRTGRKSKLTGVL